jgi:multicomponent K+:H+ antiporter subunit A
MRRINGLWKYMPYTGLLAAVAASAMAGVPLVNGFLSKEMFFGESLSLDRGGGLQWILPLAAVAGGVFSVAYSLRFVHDVFFHGKPLDVPRTPHEPPRWMRIPVEVLVAVCLLVGIFPALTVQPLLEVSSAAVIGGPAPEFSLALWHGVNLPLIMSGVAMGGGVLLYCLLQYGLDLHSHVQSRHTAKRAFDRALLGLSVAAERLTARAYRSGLTGGVFALIIVAIFAGVFPFLFATGAGGELGLTPIEPMALLIFVLMCVAAMGMVFVHRKRLPALLLLAVVGLTATLAFVYFSAPDLALTQISVEAVSILVLLLALYYLPQEAPPERAVNRALRDFFLGGLAGGGVGWLAWAMLTRPFDSISSYFIANSVQQGGGANVVNVILVDFRGYDTYGEISVIVIAALGVAAMLAGAKLPHRAADDSGRPWSLEQSFLPLDLLVRLLLPLALLVSAFLFLRGHNAPGGGFVAGLVTAVALILLYVGAGLDWTRQRLTWSFRAVAGAGLLIAGITGLAAMAGFDRPFLASAHGHVTLPMLGEVPLASAMMFDMGVYLAVVGAALLILTRLGDPDAASMRIA